MIIKPATPVRPVDWGVEEDGFAKETRLIEFYNGLRVCEPVYVWSWAKYGKGGALQRARGALHKAYLGSLGFDVDPSQQQPQHTPLSKPRR
jgi:hypothetical protein